MAIAGRATVTIAITGSVLLAVSDVGRGLVEPVIGGLTLVTFSCLWFVLSRKAVASPSFGEPLAF
jgi:hypothetical protein